MNHLYSYIIGFVVGLGNALFFLFEVLGHIVRGRIRFKEVLKQIYEQGIQSIVIIALTSFSTGMVLALQGYTMLNRFGAKE